MRVYVEDGRSFVRRSPERYDVIQASLVDTWAATAAGAYTLTENSLYTVEAFEDYLDHLSDRGVLTITRWVLDGVRLVSLAQEACARRGLDAAQHLAVIQHEKVATFILKKTPFTPAEAEQLREICTTLRFTLLYAPGLPAPATIAPTGAGHWEAANGTPNDYARLVTAPDRRAFYASYPLDITPTTDDRPFFFHTTKVKDQTSVAFGRTMLFGNGLSALMTLMMISRPAGGALHPRADGDQRPPVAGQRLAGVARLLRAPRRRLHAGGGGAAPAVRPAARPPGLLAHGDAVLPSARHRPRQLPEPPNCGCRRETAGAAGAWRCGGAGLARRGGTAAHHPAAISIGLAGRMAVAVAILLPAGLVMGVPMPAGIRLLSRTGEELLPWAWAMNGALSVVGATLAVFIAMNWGFSVTLVTGAAVYLMAAGVLSIKRV